MGGGVLLRPVLLRGPLLESVRGGVPPACRAPWSGGAERHRLCLALTEGSSVA